MEWVQRCFVRCARRCAQFLVSVLSEALQERRDKFQEPRSGRRTGAILIAEEYKPALSAGGETHR